MKIIGIGHKARQGKNLLARYLAMEAMKQGIYTKEYAFADALKIYCQLEELNWRDKVRLQQIGQKFRHDRGSNIWVNILEDRIKVEKPDLAIITDVRYLNEAAICDETIRITRIKEDGSRFQATDRDPLHPSETELDNYDFSYGVINLEGQPEHLKVTAKQIISDLFSLQVSGSDSYSNQTSSSSHKSVDQTQAHQEQSAVTNLDRLALDYTDPQKS
jgi:hypothetical protein